MCIFPSKRVPSIPPPPPVPQPEIIKPAPPTEILKKEPVSIVAPTSKRRGLGIAGQTVSPASGGVPLGIGTNPGNQTINTGTP